MISSRKILVTVLTLFLIAGLLAPNAFAASTFPDMPQDWSLKALEHAVDCGLINGIGGYIRPDGELNRAQMAAIVNRAFGAQDEADLSAFTDVSRDNWYYADMAKAVAMGTLSGAGGRLRPDDPVTREEVFVVLARAFRLSGVSDLSMFTDSDLMSDWAKEAAASLAAEGYLKGSDGKLNPKACVTRAEFAQLMYNAIAYYISESGEYENIQADSLMINTEDVVLKDSVISKDLIIGDGVGDGDVTLDGVSVGGRLVVRGGGTNSIRITGDSSINTVIISRQGNAVRVASSGSSPLSVVVVDDMSSDVIIEGKVGDIQVNASDIPVILRDAQINNITVQASSVVLSVEGNTGASNIYVGESARDMTLEVAKGASISSVVTDGSNTLIKGEGTVTQAVINADNAKVDTVGTKTEVAKDATGVTSGGAAIDAGSTVVTKENETVAGEKPTTGGSTSGGGSGGGSGSTSPRYYYANSEDELAGYIKSAVVGKRQNIIVVDKDITVTKPLTVENRVIVEVKAGVKLTNENTITLAAGEIVVKGSLINSKAGTIINEGGADEDASIDGGTITIEGGKFINEGEVVNQSSEAAMGSQGAIVLVSASGGQIVNAGVITLNGPAVLPGTEQYDHIDTMGGVIVVGESADGGSADVEFVNEKEGVIYIQSPANKDKDYFAPAFLSIKSGKFTNNGRIENDSAIVIRSIAVLDNSNGTIVNTGSIRVFKNVNDAAEGWPNLVEGNGVIDNDGGGTVERLITDDDDVIVDERTELTADDVMTDGEGNKYIDITERRFIKDLTVKSSVGSDTYINAYGTKIDGKLILETGESYYVGFSEAEAKYIETTNKGSKYDVEVPTIEVRSGLTINAKDANLRVILKESKGNITFNDVKLTADDMGEDESVQLALWYAGNYDDEIPAIVTSCEGRISSVAVTEDIEITSGSAIRAFDFWGLSSDAVLDMGNVTGAEDAVAVTVWGASPEEGNDGVLTLKGNVNGNIRVGRGSVDVSNHELEVTGHISTGTWDLADLSIGTKAITVFASDENQTVSIRADEGGRVILLPRAEVKMNGVYLSNDTEEAVGYIIVDGKVAEGQIIDEDVAEKK